MVAVKYLGTYHIRFKDTPPVLQHATKYQITDGRRGFYPMPERTCKQRIVKLPPVLSC